MLCSEIFQKRKGVHVSLSCSLVTTVLIGSRTMKPTEKAKIYSNGRVAAKLL